MGDIEETLNTYTANAKEAVGKADIEKLLMPLGMTGTLLLGLAFGWVISNKTREVIVDKVGFELPNYSKAE